jgi:hypothetical protein
MGPIKVEDYSKLLNSSKWVNFLIIVTVSNKSIMLFLFQITIANSLSNVPLLVCIKKNIVILGVDSDKAFFKNINNL